MSASEIVIAVLGVVVGYWVVSKLFMPKAGVRIAAAAHSPRMTAWHEVLGVPPTATPDEIKDAYRTLMSQYHPDKVASLGEELRLLAERKSKEISAAYREGMQVRGIAI